MVLFEELHAFAFWLRKVVQEWAGAPRHTRQRDHSRPCTLAVFLSSLNCAFESPNLAAILGLQGRAQGSEQRFRCVLLHVGTHSFTFSQIVTLTIAQLHAATTGGAVKAHRLTR